MATTDTPQAPRTRLDIMHADMAADPWPALKQLRELGPVVWHEDYQRWLIVSERAVRQVLVDSRRFTVEGTIVENLFGADAFIAMDDRKRHDGLRNVWAAAFNKQGLDHLQPAVAQIVDRLLAPIVQALLDGEAVDLSTALCRPLPTLVIATMMGIPDSMLPDIVRWSDDMAAGGPAYLSAAMAKLAHQRRDDAKAALANYLRDLLNERRRRPGDDLISQLASAEVAKDLSIEQLIPNVRQLLFAGNETTAKWLANIFVTYGEHAAVRRELARDPALIPTANDEVMRWQGVVGSVVRRVRGGAVDIEGITLADGDDVTCVLSAANRDPARYENPDDFNIHRPPQPNFGFGMGFHFCLGSLLAKLEAQLAVTGLLDRIPDYAIAEPYHYSSLPMRGPLPVVIRRAGS